MVTINKVNFFSEVKKLNLSNTGLTDDDFSSLYYAAVNDIDISPEELKKLLLKIQSGLFEKAYFAQVLIPLDFFDSEVGKVFLKLKYGINSSVFLISDLQKITGYSVQYLSKEAQLGNLKGERRGKIWIFTGDQVEDYLLKKGYSHTSFAYISKDEVIHSDDAFHKVGMDKSKFTYGNLDEKIFD